MIRSIGALNPVDARWLAEGRARFARFADQRAPRTTVLIGATNRAQRLDAAYFDALLERLARVARDRRRQLSGQRVATHAA